MGLIRSFLAAAAAFAALASHQPATARLTAEDEAAVPQDVLNAYKSILQQRMYVCPRTDLKKADRTLAGLIDKIRVRYRADFDILQAGEEIVIPTHCPSPKSIPDFRARSVAYGRAVRQLSDALDRHPSPVDEALSREDIALRFLFLRVLSRFPTKQEGAVCINRTILGMKAGDLASLKRATIEVSPALLANGHRRRLESDFFSRIRPDSPPRVFNPPPMSWGSKNIRSATSEECSHHTTYIVRRPLIADDMTMLSGVVRHFGGALFFAAVAEKSSDGWSLVRFIPYDGFSGPPSSAQFKRVLPGQAGDQFFILE